MTEILSHELSHVYDVRKLLLDLRDCENLAYSEVRAARIAECRHSGNSNSGGGGGGGQHIGGGGGAASAGIGFGGLRSWYLPSYYSSSSNSSNSNHTSGMHQQRSCVRQKAVTATLNLFPGQARACLNAVFDAAMADHRPILPPPTTPTSSNQAAAVQSASSAAVQAARPASSFRAATHGSPDSAIPRQSSSYSGASPPSSNR
jgi:Peptidase M76 family